MLRLLALINTLVIFPFMLGQVIVGAIIHLVGRLCKSQSLKTHGKDLAVAADQNVNVIWLGYPDETISSRTGRAILSGKPKWYIRYLLWPFVDKAAQFFGDKPDHCVRAVEHDLDMDKQYEIWKWFKE